MLGYNFDNINKMSRRLESPSRTYVAMPFVTDDTAGDRKINYNNSSESGIAHNHVKISGINAERKKIPAYNQFDFNSSGPFRKLEPPDAPHPNQDLNQHNDYDKTGQSGEVNVVRITNNVHQMNYQGIISTQLPVKKSYDFHNPIPSTSKLEQAKKAEEVAEKKTEHICINVEDSEESSDSTFFDERKNSKKERLLYTGAEDLEILKFVLRGDNIYRTSSVLLWKELESKKTNPKRTFQSLKNRFLRNIKPLILTKYGKFVNSEKAKMLMKKFPELARVKKTGETHPCLPIQWRQKKKKPLLNPCLSKERVRLETLANAGTTDRRPGNVRAFKGVSVEPERELVDLVSSPENKTFGRKVKKEPAAVPRIELKKKGRLKDVSCQKFEYSASLCSFKEKAAINLDLILIRDIINCGKMSKRTLLNGTDKPVNVRVTVSLSTGPVKKKLRGRSRRKEIKNRPENVYFLKLRKRKGENWKKKARTYEEVAKILFSMIEERKNDADEGSDDDEDKVDKMVLRSQTRSIETREEEKGSMTEFESSSDDGSYLSEAIRKVESMYKVVILPSSEIEGSQNSEVCENRREDAKTLDRECKSISLLKNMMGQMGQNVKR